MNEDIFGLLKPLQENQSRFDFWSKVLIDNKYTVVAEVGVWKGEFAEVMLGACTQLESYYMIDPWRSLSDWNKPFNVSDGEFRDVYAEAMSRTEFASRKLTIYREETISAVKKIEDKSLDFVYVDGDHTLRGITIDLISMLPKVKIGGLLAGDDFTHSPWQHSVDYEPTLIFPYAVYFAEAMGLPLYAFGKNQFAIHNRSDLGFSFNDLTSSYLKPNLCSLYERV